MSTDSRTVGVALRGRTFGPLAVDYLLIGGGLSLLFTALIVSRGGGAAVLGYASLPYFLLLSNATHFAASTVRLYSKPGTFQSLPFLTLIFPLVSLLVLTLMIWDPERLGIHFQSLYLTWSPYHYAAQAYGLAVMYSYRSGCMLSAGNKKLLWWVSMFPFLFNFVTAPDVGLSWLVPENVLAGPAVAAGRVWLGRALWALAVLTPPLLYVTVWRSKSGVMPLISIMAVIANGVWFLVLGPLDAFVWATVFHGIQYLAIVIVFHVKERMSQPGNRHGRTYHALWFYGVSLVLAVGLFNLLPMAYVFAGVGKVQAMLMVVAAINIHHFIVDAYIWRLKRGDGNREIIETGTVARDYLPQPG